MMTKDSINNNLENRITELEKKIEKYNKAYYDENKSLVSDYEYDLLKKELENLRSKIKPRSTLFGDTFIEQRVGFRANGRFKKIIHKQQMMSLANALTKEEFDDYVERTNRFLKLDTFPECVCELKIDGLSFSAMYSMGKLQYIATRGDGLIGEDVSNNALQISTFPRELPVDSEVSKLNEFEVRGEIYMPKDAFEKLNEELDDKSKFSNPRNAASGTLRQLNPEIVKQRNLSYYAYAIGVCSKEIVKTQQEALLLLKKLGFIVNDNFELVKNIDDIIKYHEKIAEIRYELDCDIDGIVVKVNDFELQKKLGSTAHDPRWAIAYKFSGITATTKIINIVNQVGRTGVITPVAELIPVNIGGVIVKRATLHNYDEIQRLGLAINDLVVVKRAGDVIPKIVGVKKQCSDRISIKKPVYCPCCGSEVSQDEDEVAIICKNHIGCKDQIIDRIRHFASRNGIDINGLGKKVISRFYDLGILKDVLDIFSLKNHIQTLENLDGFGVKSTQNLLSSIEEAKHRSFDKVLYAIGIPDVGENIAKIIAKYYDGFSNLIEDKENFSHIVGINGLGDELIQNMIKYFNDENNLLFIKKLDEIMTIYPIFIDKSKANEKFIGKSVIFTGKLQNMTRDQAKIQAESLGFKVLSSMSGKTDYLVYGEDAGSKLKRAQELGVKTISEEEWKIMIEK